LPHTPQIRKPMMRLRYSNKPRLTVNECDHITVAQFGHKLVTAGYKKACAYASP